MDEVPKISVEDKKEEEDTTDNKNTEQDNNNNSNNNNENNFLDTPKLSDYGFLRASQEGDVCHICLEIYEDPRQLECCHSFCKECIIYMKKERDSEKKPGTREAYIPCPLCTKETILDINDTELKSLNVDEELEEVSNKIRELSKDQDNESNKLLEEKLNSFNQIVVPRNIKLLQEFDAAIGKNGLTFIPPFHIGMITYGVMEGNNSEDDMHLTNWHAIIIGPQESPIGQIIYTYEIVVPDDYPKAPPEVYFVEPKILMNCVDDTGKVDLSKIEKVDLQTLNYQTGMIEKTTGEFYKWDPSQNIADVLVAIRENMHLSYVCGPSEYLGGSYR
eukprot:TRINITY_DN1025_c0_g2_i2.p1 TRINITY_DN1025_c0_g2~~TRINITY_DN1025_c0_g2_i2.p1  ORF type:complete len:332 (-),score=112.08 TRINITY_DN1025_c0_g2_i2:99-1094(-)